MSKEFRRRADGSATLRLASLAPEREREKAQPTFQIMQRRPQTGANSPATDGNGEGGPTSRKTLEQREAEYALARERIFQSQAQGQSQTQPPKEPKKAYEPVFASLHHPPKPDRQQEFEFGAYYDPTAMAPMPYGYQAMYPGYPPYQQGYEYDPGMMYGWQAQAQHAGGPHPQGQAMMQQWGYPMGMQQDMGQQPQAHMQQTMGGGQGMQGLPGGHVGMGVAVQGMQGGHGGHGLPGGIPPSMPSAMQAQPPMQSQASIRVQGSRGYSANTYGYGNPSVQLHHPQPQRPPMQPHSSASSSISSRSYQDYSRPHSRGSTTSTRSATSSVRMGNMFAAHAHGHGNGHAHAQGHAYRQQGMKWNAHGQNQAPAPGHGHGNGRVHGRGHSPVSRACIVK